MPADPFEPVLLQVEARLKEGQPQAAQSLCRQILAQQPGHAAAWHWLGIVAFTLRNYAEAEHGFRQAISCAPAVPMYRSDFAAVLRLTGRLEEAIGHFREALKLDPNLADAQQNLGEALLATARPEEALTHCARAVELRPRHAVAHSNLAMALSRLERAEEAEAACRRALELDPRCAPAWHNLGVVHLHRQRWAEALEALERALAIDPRFTEALANRGVALREISKRQPRGSAEAAQLLTAARVSLEQALALRPAYADGHTNLGLTLVEIALSPENRRLAEVAADLRAAVACLDRAVALRPPFAPAHSHRGGALIELARVDPSRAPTLLHEALASLDRALALDPKLAVAQTNRAHAFNELGRREEAEEAARSALRVDPEDFEAQITLATLLFYRGAWPEGWTAYEARLRRRGSRDSLSRGFNVPPWTGRPLAACQTLLVHAEQGFGDTLFFARYLPAIRARSPEARLVVECQTPLLRLLRANLLGATEIVAREAWDGATLPHFDFHVSMPSLPFVLGLPEPLAERTPLLEADTGLREVWRERLAGCKGLRVGLAWSGNPQHINDRRRSLHRDALARLCPQAGVTFCSLHPPAPPAALDFSAHLTDFAETAALISELDLIVTVDTAVAHLAGSLGAKVWTLLPTPPDWRWGSAGESTPWYPTMRLFRQPTPGDWETVLEKANEALRAETAKT